MIYFEIFIGKIIFREQIFIKDWTTLPHARATLNFLLFIHKKKRQIILARYSQQVFSRDRVLARFSCFAANHNKLHWVARFWKPVKMFFLFAFAEYFALVSVVVTLWRGFSASVIGPRFLRVYCSRPIFWGALKSENLTPFPVSCSACCRTQT